MLELYSLKALDNAEKDPNKTPAEKRTLAMARAISAVVILIIYAWAFMRAYKCSQPNPDSRAIHFAFASLSPVLYIILTYLVPGFGSQ